MQTGNIATSTSSIQREERMATARYTTMLFGLILAGCGAGVLSGETAKVSMSVIPPERAGMASGVSGTIRFSGIVLAFGALGTILYQRIASVVEQALPAYSSVDRSIPHTRNCVWKSQCHDFLGSINRGH
jgi:hypothetical protein